jgi:hypothetical protein
VLDPEAHAAGSKLPQSCTPEGWPEAMRAEWGNDEGSPPPRAIARRWWVGSTRRAQRSMRSARLRADVGRRPVREFQGNVVPPYCIAAYDRFKFATPPARVGRNRQGVRPAGSSRGRQMLASRLIEEGFDTA